MTLLFVLFPHSDYVGWPPGSIVVVCIAGDVAQLVGEGDSHLAAVIILHHYLQSREYMCWQFSNRIFWDLQSWVLGHDLGQFGSFVSEWGVEHFSVQLFKKEKGATCVGVFLQSLVQFLWERPVWEKALLTRCPLTTSSSPPLSNATLQFTFSNFLITMMYLIRSTAAHRAHTHHLTPISPNPPTMWVTVGDPHHTPHSYHIWIFDAIINRITLTDTGRWVQQGQGGEAEPGEQKTCF